MATVGGRPAGGLLVQAAGLLAGALAALLGFGADPALAAGGKLYQYSGPYGCATITGLDNCATVRGLRGAQAVAVAPDGLNAYVASNEEGSVTTFTRDNRGRIVQRAGLNGCISYTGRRKCSTGRNLFGAYSVAVSPDGANVYAATSDGVAVFAREGDKGNLRQLSGPRGCFNRDGAENCTAGRGLAVASSVVVSPDGKNVYVAAFGSHAIATFARDPATGELAQLPGAAGCIGQHGGDGCSTGRALLGPISVAVSPGGQYVFAASHFSDAVTRLVRDPSTGALSQTQEVNTCLSLGGGNGCAMGRGIKNPDAIAVSGDGASLYVASSGSDAVAAIGIGNDGSLSQLPGGRGCVSARGTEGCTAARSLGNVAGVAVSSDDRNVYAVSDLAVTAFRRASALKAPERFGSLKKIDCISDGGEVGCATGRGLDIATSVALDPEGHNLYVTAYDSGGISSFARDPQRGKVRVRLRGVPKKCVSRPFKVRVSVKSRFRLRRVYVYLNGRKQGLSRRNGFSSEAFKLRVRALRRGNSRLTVRAKDVIGTKGRHKAKLRRC